MTRTTPPSREPVSARYGAPMGRPSVYHPGNYDAAPTKLYLRAIRLNSQGYDPGGAYWGHGGWIWEAWDAEGSVYLTGRVYQGSPERKATYERLKAEQDARGGWMDNLDRETAKDAVRDILGPNACFHSPRDHHK